MSRIAFSFAMRRSWRRALVLAGVLALFCWMSLAISASFLRDVGGVQIFANPPRALSAFLGGEGSFVSPEGWLATTFMHPVVLSMSAIGAFLVASRTGAAELEAGTLDLVLSRPVARGDHLRGRLAAALVCSTIVQAGTFAGVLFAAASIADIRALPLGRVAMTCAGSAALYAFFTAAGMWVFAGGSSRGRAMGWAIALVTGSYLVNFVALAFEATAFLSPATPFRYFRPGSLINGEEILRTFTVLPLAALLCAIGAGWTFTRRDLAR